MRISIIGCGYVGLTTGLALAETGNQVVLVDVVKEKLRAVEEGRSPFYEPGVDEMILKHRSSRALSTTEDLRRAVKGSDITFIAVGTPSREDGSMDDTFIISAAKEIGDALKTKEGRHVVVMKSTVVPGTTWNTIRPLMEENSGRKAGPGLGIAMCPEFLREGAAMHDSLHPDRVVIGTMEDETFEVLERLFAPLDSRILRTDPTTAEMIKYASNSLLATKISFANELSRICERVGVDVYDVMEGVGLDSRISPQFLRAGVGFGGSCFPKDVSALRYLAREKSVPTPILDGVMENNEIQPGHLVQVAERTMGGLKDVRVLVLGLAFKPDTDDVRFTRSLPVARHLDSLGARVAGHDPKAIENFRKEAPPEMSFFDDHEEGLSWADVVFLMTEWPEYASIEWGRYPNIRAIFDGRRTIEPASVKGIAYWSLGSPLPEP